MFISSSEKKSITDKLRILEEEVAQMRLRFDAFFDAKKKAPYGLKKDGTPRKKPGRKTFLEPF